MHIFASKGTKVKFINDQRSSYGVGGIDNELLTLNEVYTIDKTEVHRFYTKVYLEEFPEAVFNSVCFKDVEERPRLDDEMREYF